MKKIIWSIVILTMTISCAKNIDYGLEGDLPSKPDFTIEEVDGDPNSFVVTDLSSGSFTRLWEFQNGIPQTSKLVSDTVQFTKKGTYGIKLHVSSSDGSGTAVSSKEVIVEQDIAGCQFAMLNEDCSTKCWRLSGEPGSVVIGPTPFSSEWYSSPDITDNQADDRWCFNEDGTLEYNNGGASFSACQGYIDVDDFPIPAEINWSFSAGSGEQGLDRISIDGIFMGVEDSGPTYDVFEISETKMVLLAPNKPCDGTGSTGWFTLTFFSAE
ncbi:PKD domain-containing protein [Portibacter lacus]|nr:PKD domain-containing protein [Portibacter lacus]